MALGTILATLAPYAIQAGAHFGSQYLGNRREDKQRRKAQEREAQQNLIGSFDRQKIQDPNSAVRSTPGAGEQLLGDPLTQRLLSELGTKGIEALFARGGPKPITPSSSAGNASSFGNIRDLRRSPTPFLTG